MTKQAASILAADFGSVTTRVLLFEPVDGVYRVIARGEGRTTIGYPVDDLSVGLSRILKSLSDTTGRRFYGPGERILMPQQPDRSGVDYFVTTASVGRPVRVALVGLAPDLSVTSARKALEGTYMEAAEAVSLFDKRDSGDRLNAILLSRPDVILIVGGTDDSKPAPLMELIEIVRLVLLSYDAHRRPFVVYAGAVGLAARVRERIGDLTRLLIAPNVRPTLDREVMGPLIAQLDRAFDEYHEAQSPAFNLVGAMNTGGIMPTAQASTFVIEYLARTRKQSILAVDMGSASTFVIRANGRTSDTQVRARIGLGINAPELIDKIGLTAIQSWLPFHMSAADLRDYVLNKSLHPASVPMNLRDLYIEHGLLRAGMRKILGQLSPLDSGGDTPPQHIFASGSAFTRSGVPAMDLMLIADCVQPVGIVEITADGSGLLPALGATSLSRPEAVVQLLDTGALERLGFIIAPNGYSTADNAMQLKIMTEDGEQYEHSIAGGDLWLLPLPTDVSLNIEIRLARGLSLNGRRRMRFRLGGGRAGLLFDLRGRPLRLGVTAQERAGQMPQWIAAVTGDDVVPIPARWLEVSDLPVSEPEVELRQAEGKTEKEEKASRQDKKKDRRSRRRRKAQEVDPEFEALLNESGDEDFSELEGKEDDLDALRRDL